MYSAIITVVRCVFAHGTLGMIDASITRKPANAEHAAAVDRRR